MENFDADDPAYGRWFDAHRFEECGSNWGDFERLRRDDPDVRRKYLEWKLQEAQEQASRDSPLIEQEQRDLEHKERERVQKLRAAWVRVVGPRFADCTLDNFAVSHDAQATAVATCRDYAERLMAQNSPSGSLLLYGPTGAGKDHLASGVCHLLVAAGWQPVAWDDGDDDDDKLSRYLGYERRRSFSSGRTLAVASGARLWASRRDAMHAGDEVRWVDRLVGVGLLVLSDPTGVGSGSLSNFAADGLYAVIDGRYRARKPTIVTINCRDRAEMDAMLTRPVADRLRHDAVAVPCDWPSYRKTASAHNNQHPD